jgi:hypothetical protein
LSHSLSSKITHGASLERLPRLFSLRVVAIAALGVDVVGAVVEVHKAGGLRERVVERVVFQSEGRHQG